MIFLRTTILTILLTLTGLSSPVLAQQDQAATASCAEGSGDCQQPADTNPATGTGQSDDSFFGFLDRPQKVVSTGLSGLVKNMDQFFAEEQVYYDHSGSYARVSLDTVFTEQEGERDTQFTGDLKVKLQLPRTEKKLKLTFETDPTETQDVLDRALADTPAELAQDKRIYGGVQTELGDESKWRFKPGFGLTFSKPIDVYLRLRIDRVYRWENWLFRPNQTFYTFKESGFGSDTQLNFDYQIADNALFRSISFVRYTDENDYYEPSQQFSVIHALTPRRAMIYLVGIYGNTDQSLHATDYQLQLRYRQNIHSYFLFAEVIPEILYQKENSFEPEHSITLRLEMVFDG